jgi:hypothetical protein
MFCLGCGAELSARAEVCAVCGRPAHPESPLSPRASQRVMLTASSATRSPARSMERAANPYVSPSARVATPSVASGDLALFALPSDVTGRLVVALPLLLSADLLAPWILFGDAHIAPVRAGLLVLLAALPLALIAGMTVYLPFRQRPILAAIPLAIAALALGGGLTLLLVVGPFGARIVNVIGAGTLAHLNVFLVTGAQTPIPAPLTLSPDLGLYAFIAGAGALVVACYRRLEDLIASQYIVAAQSETIAAPLAAERQEADGAQERREILPPTPSSAEARAGKTRLEATLPGTPGWTEAPELPDIVRNAPPIRGLRRINPRG